VQIALDATLLEVSVAIGVCAVRAACMLGVKMFPTERHRLRAIPMMTPDDLRVTVDAQDLLGHEFARAATN